jgi:hypothetical protein
MKQGSSSTRPLPGRCGCESPDDLVCFGSASVLEEGEEEVVVVVV